MSILEIIGGVLILIACLFCIVICLMQEQKQQNNMSSALTGASNDSFYKHNEGRTKEAVLNKVTRTLAIIFFVATLAVNIVPIFVK
ncbi:MAG TPA: preprotein translocase subunit SecG [Ruminococcus sp.]|nr:preprotein translocase subunit SecG [Ruminococcus sp.]